MTYFGTDGMRGEVFKSIDHKIAFDCGNALCNIKDNPKIIVGKDTRVSGDYITLAFCLGAILGGATVVDVDICPSAAVAYLTQNLGYDFGIVVTASHNPPTHNGIKIFSGKGQKLGDEYEKQLEKYFGNYIRKDVMRLGKYKKLPKIKQKYINFLKKTIKTELFGLKIVLDCCHGASTKIAPKLFKQLGAKVITINESPDGSKINVSCGATDVSKLKIAVKNNKADVGFAFDGDSDRVIAVDEKGEEVDGDKILYIIAKYMKNQYILKNNLVVGTKLTNLGIQNALNDNGIAVKLADVGDKYVIDEMIKSGGVLGGEKAGHIILSDYLKTGDGILCAVKLAEILKLSQKKFSELANVEIYPQISINCAVKNKDAVISNEQLNDMIRDIERVCAGKIYIVVRKSGTENVIRIMTMGKDEILATKYAKMIEQKVKEIDHH